MRRYIVEYQVAGGTPVERRVFRSHNAAQDFVDKHRAIAYSESKRGARRGKLRRRSSWVWFQQSVV